MSDDVRVRDKPVKYRGKWCAVVYTWGDRKRFSLGTDDDSQAEAALSRFKSELKKPQGETVKHLWEGYTSDNAGKPVIVTMGHTWKALDRRFGHLTADSITVEHCRAHMEARRKAGIKDGTIWTELGHLRMVMLWAKKRRYISEAPHIERPRKPDPKDRYLTKREAARVKAAATMPHLKLYIILALTTAGRREALLSLTWDRVDFDHGVISLRDPDDPTRRKGRATVPMNRMLRAALQEAHRGKQSDHVIEWAGEAVTSVKKGLATAGRKAKVLGVTSHLLRHSAAVWMRQAGRPIGEIAEFLGHSDSKITERVYAKYGPAFLKEASEALEFDDLGGTMEPPVTTQGAAK